MRVEFHQAASTEVEDAQAWYEQRSLLAASAFLRELSAAVDHIRDAPMRYPVAPLDTRRILLERFPFALHYRVREDLLTVVAVAHLKRRPGYWSNR